MIGLFSSLFVYRDMSLADVWRITIGTGRITAQILVIVCCSSLYAWLLTSQGVPQRMTAVVAAMQLPPWAILVALNIILLIAGMLLDLTSATLILTPLFVPIVRAADVDLIHFGIILTTNLGLGSYTPPMAPNIFTTQSMLNVPASRIIPGLIPFIVLHLIVILPDHLHPGPFAMAGEVMLPPATHRGIVAAALLIAAVALNFSNVIARYAFGRPIVTAEEILQFANVWIVMLAGAGGLASRHPSAHGHPCAIHAPARPDRDRSCDRHARRRPRRLRRRQCRAHRRADL